ncbi:hypothetical protein Tco_1281074 [Tanacetum coccineum]
MGIDPVTHKSSIRVATNLSHMTQWGNARLEAEARLVPKSSLISESYHRSQDSLTNESLVEHCLSKLRFSIISRLGGDVINNFYAKLCSSKAVTAGFFRVFGRNIAELSIVATSKSYQEKVVRSKDALMPFSTALRVFFHIKKKIRQIEGEGEDGF